MGSGFDSNAALTTEGTSNVRKIPPDTGLHITGAASAMEVYAPVRDPRGQIKTRERVRSLAEVYTHEREVHAMLDLIPDMFPDGSTQRVDLTYLEPACGSGNFLEDILRRKLAGIRFSRIRSVPRYEHWLLRALASIYGVDICIDNVTESRHRLIEFTHSYYHNHANTITPTKGFLSAARAIVRTNIIRADFLADAATTEVVEYKSGRGGMFMRTWSMLDDSAEAQSEPDLFNPEPQPKRDQAPVHYTELAAQPEPTRSATMDGIRKGA